MKTHYEICQVGRSRQTYPGGVYTPEENIFKTLQKHGVEVRESNFVYPSRATFDFEVYFLPPDPTKNTTEHTTFTARHEVLSCSVASNVDGHTEPVCFINEGEPQAVVNNMITKLEQISDSAYASLLQKCDYLFDQLDEIDQEQLVREDSLNIPVEALREKLDRFCRELPVIGFNSGRYDLCVIKEFFIPHFVLRQSQDSGSSPFRFVVKRNNNYMAIITEKLRFLDILNFLAPGLSYSKYLSAFKVTEEKGFFPYEYLTNLQQLSETQLPPHAAFFSKLSNTNISMEEYEGCKRVWVEYSMTTLADYLRHYNNKDVKPFICAFDTHVRIYSQLGLDLLKDGMSVPGVILKYLFQTLENRFVYFSLFNETQKEVHTLLRENMTGGPSIIFTRYAETDKTHIRDNPNKPVKISERV